MKALKTKLKKVTATHRGRTIFYSILAFFVVAISAGIWYWNTHKKAIIRDKLENAVREQSGGLYNIKFDSLQIDELAGYLSISNMNLWYDSTRFLELKKTENVPSILIKIYIPEISVTGLKTPRALIDDEIVGRKLEIKNPVINIIYTNSGKDSSRNIPSKEIYEQILGKLDLIQADTVLISGAQINTSSLRNKKIGIKVEDITITLLDVKVDSSSNADSTRMLFAKESRFTCGKVSWSTPSKLYNYTADSVSLNSASNDLRIKNFRYTPTLNEDAFVNALPTQDDRFDFFISDIQIKNINLPQLFEENIVADSLLIGSATFKIYRDIAKPRDKKNRLGFYPQQVIQRIPVSFRVGKIIQSNGFIEYKERNHITRKSGKVQFYNVYATISNFTNEKKAIAANNVMTAVISTRLLNKTPMRATWQFYLRDPKGRFDLNGSIGPIDATQLNPLAEPMGPASIKEGRIHGTEFNLQGHDYGMDGRVKFLYEDMSVILLEKDKGETKLDKKFLSTFIANIAIKNSNPKKNQDVRIMQVHFDRDMNRSIFHLAWKTLFKGIKESAGIKK